MRQFWKLAAMTALAAGLLTCGAYAALPETLVPVGQTIGLQLQTDGVSIVEFAGDNPCAKNAGLRRGDIIRKIDTTQVTTVQEVMAAVEQSDGSALTVTFERAGEERCVKLAPQQTADGWRLGVYVRDSITGIGTVTYYNTETGEFGALGHGVNDSVTAQLLPLRSGTVIPSQVASVAKGAVGKPGALQGALLNQTQLGVIAQNTEHGIFGTMSPIGTGHALPVAKNAEIRTGSATILSNVSGTEVREYSIRIRALCPDDPHGRNLLIEVTDPALLDQTGGIVQGMSGSPILQNGKLVGAVTHVLVNDPTQGYGIFIENMLNTAQTAASPRYISFIDMKVKKYPKLFESRVLTLDRPHQDPNLRRNHHRRIYIFSEEQSLH